MTEDVADRLRAILAATQGHIESLRSMGLNETAKVAAVLRLELQTKLHGISDQELVAFSDALRAANGIAPQAEIIDLSTRISRKA
jgi:hypothetical protein